MSANSPKSILCALAAALLLFLPAMDRAQQTDPPASATSSGARPDGAAPTNVVAPVVLSAPVPVFSKQERRQEVNGSVLLGLVVDEKGLPTQVRVLRGLRDDLDQKAVQAVEQYRFKPAMKDGVPISVKMNVEVNFQILRQH